MKNETLEFRMMISDRIKLVSEKPIAKALPTWKQIYFRILCMNEKPDIQEILTHHIRQEVRNRDYETLNF